MFGTTCLYLVDLRTRISTHAHQSSYWKGEGKWGSYLLSAEEHIL